MKTPIRWLTPLFFLLVFSLPAWADYANPVGIWDRSGKASLHVTFSGLNLSARRAKVTDTVQFHDGGRFGTLSMAGVDGRWRDANQKRRYRISYDANQINDSATTSLLPQMADQFFQLAIKTFGPVGGFFTIQDIQVKSYKDKAILNKRGLKLKGLAKIRANIVFTVPGGTKAVTAHAHFRLRYKDERASAPSTCCSSDDPLQNLADSQAFLRDNALLPKVQQTASGLQYRVLREGSGNTPSASDSVTVNYRGTLPSGVEFDRGSQASFPLNGVIAGWAEGLQRVREGGVYRFYIPPELAYGSQGTGALIKPNTALIFDVQLLRIDG